MCTRPYVHTNKHTHMYVNKTGTDFVSDMLLVAAATLIDLNQFLYVCMYTLVTRNEAIGVLYFVDFFFNWWEKIYGWGLNC